ncbi:MAG: PAS domain S-box protein [Spirochaetales bacterium]|nr:PAS domain S-box protein [Spirochaetales bacterium]
MKRVFTLLILLTPLFLYGESWHVLYLSSYHPAFPTYHRQIEGIKSAFRGDELDLDEEFIDSKRLGFQENRNSFTARLRYKLSQLPPYDLVICADDNALIFMQDSSEELFPRIPYVFLGVNNIENGLSANRNPLATGVLEEVSLEANFMLIKAQFPQATELIVISDNTSSGKADLQSLKAYSAGQSIFKLTVFNLEALSFPELEEKLEKARADVPILLLSAYTDADGVTLDFTPSFRRIYSFAKGPIYHLWEHGFGEGALGGFVVDHYTQGEKAGDMARRILLGESPEDIPVSRTSPNHYLMDYREMKRWGLRRRNCPDGTTYLNDPRKNQRLLRRFIINLLLSLGILLLIILLFIRLNRELKKANRNLAESRRRFENVFINNPVILMLIKIRDGRISDINTQGLTFYGYNREEIHSMTIYQINQLSREQIQAEMAKARQEGRTHFQFRHRLKNGDIKDVEVFTTPLVIGGEEYLLSAVHDITEKTRLQRELIQREKMDALGFLAGGIAHDFNNLLTGIIGHCDLMAMTPCDERQNRSSMQMILKSALKAKDLTQKILSYSRQKQKEREKLVPADIIEEFLEQNFNQIPEGISVQRIYESRGRVLGNRTEMEQVVQNLLTNGIQSMEEGGGVLTVTTREESEDSRGYLVIEIKDQGVGIPPEGMKNIFDPYYSTKRMGLGTGLGLAIVRSIIEDEGGSIRVDSEVGRGTSFLVSLLLLNE